MPEPRKPQDRKAKTEKPSDTYTATIDGVEFVSASLSETFTGGFFRRHRKLDDIDQAYTMVEAAFDGNDAFFDAFDALYVSEQQPIFKALSDAVGATVGES